MNVREKRVQSYIDATQAFLREVAAWPTCDQITALSFFADAIASNYEDWDTTDVLLAAAHVATMSEPLDIERAH